MRNRNQFRLLSIFLILSLVLAACVPGSGPRLRSLHGQTWGSSFNLQVQLLGGSTVNLPVRLELAFEQRFTDISADASLAYDLPIFRLHFGDTDLDGRLGLDDSRSLSNDSGRLQFDGRLIGHRLPGLLSTAGLVPVSEVTLTRVR